MLESVRTLISKYNVGPTKTRISIVTYDKKAQVRVSFKELEKQNKDALNSLLDSMKARDKLGGITRTDLALETVGNEVFTTANGDRPNSPNVMIVFTDGATHKKSKPYSEVLTPLVVSIICTILRYHQGRLACYQRETPYNRKLKKRRLQRERESNNNFGRELRFLYISLLSLHDYNLKMPNLTWPYFNGLYGEAQSERGTSFFRPHISERVRISLVEEQICLSVFKKT